MYSLLFHSVKDANRCIEVNNISKMAEQIGSGVNIKVKWERETGEGEVDCFPTA